MCNFTMTGIMDTIKPITNLHFVLRCGAQINITTSLSAEDFIELYNATRRKFRVITDQNCFAEIDKKYVAFYHATPIEEKENQKVPSGVEAVPFAGSY